jgi:hypothetical protein
MIKSGQTKRVVLVADMRDETWARASGKATWTALAVEGGITFKFILKK